jgi:hypothetical protein
MPAGVRQGAVADLGEAVEFLRGQVPGGGGEVVSELVEGAGAASTTELRREIHEGPQVVENWSSANTDLFYGKDGVLTGSDRENQEVSLLALHLLQSALVFVNTLLVSRSSRTRPGPTASPTPTGAPCPRCSGHTPTCTEPSRSTWRRTSTSTMNTGPDRVHGQV